MAALAAYLSAGCAFVAALLWWLSARVKTPRDFNVHVHEAGTLGSLGGLTPLLGHGFSPELSALGNALVRQSTFSAWAAGFAGASALLQGLGFLVSQG
jgi:hypothetical protein